MTVVEHPTPAGEIGKARLRVEDFRLVTGEGRFVDDLRLPGTLEMAFVRSPYPHARITSVDATAARAAPGVAAVLVGADVPAIDKLPVIPLAGDLKVPPFEPLAAQVVRAVAMPVAAVIADSRWTAADAAALVDVAYDPLPSVSDAEAALAPDAPVLYPEFGSNVAYTFRRASGDVEAAFAQAHRTVALRVAFPRLAPVPMEPRGVLASYDRSTGELTVWVTTQSPNGTRSLLAQALDMPEHHIRVIAPDVGGGFGARNAVYPEYIVAAWASRLLRRPVRWVATRSEDVATTTHGRDEIVDVEAAADRDGKLLGIRARVIGNMGGFMYTNTQLPPARIPTLLPGCYHVPNYQADLVSVFTNTNPTAPYRGAGRPEAADTSERVMDALARALDMDPVELRKRNFIRPAEFPFKTVTGVTYDSGEYAKALDTLIEVADYAGLKEQQRQERARGERTLLGIGIASFTEPSGSGWESAHVRIEASGRVTAMTGSSAHGQGHETSFAQILSARLGVPFEQIVIRHGDTAVSPPGVGTFGSRSTVVGGTALINAADQVTIKAKRIAASLLEASPDDIQLEEGRFRIAGVADKSVTWAQVAAVAYGRGRLPPGETLGLETSYYYQAPSDTYGFGAALAVVRIDPDTGHVHVEKLVAVDDCGTIVNPLLVEGQVHGGTAQGLGQALLERMVYEPDGAVITGSLMHYALPRANDMPPIVIAETVTPSPYNPLGVKGVGESGTIIGTAPVMNAVADALAPLGIQHLDMPYTAERVWAAIQQARGQG